MKKRTHTLNSMAVIALLITSFVACDKDFADIDSDIINNASATHFSTDDTLYNVIAHTRALGPVQTNDLPINMLGIYNDPNYGKTTASLVAQLFPSTIDPDFGVDPILDSVVLTIPYFATATEVTDEGETIFRTDSVFGSSPIKLSLFENNYFLRDFNPSGDEVNNPQFYYSNMTTGIDMIGTSLLEGTPIDVIPANPLDASTISLSSFVPSAKQIVLKDADDVNTRLSPSLRVKLVTDFWKEKIIDMEDQSVLSNQNNFLNYLRGIYFKVEAIGDSGNMTLLNLQSTNANITLYYSRDSDTDGEFVNSTYVLSFNRSGNVNENIVNFISNDFIITEGDSITGDENLFLKGGQGAIAEINLFNGDDLDDLPGENTFEAFKNKFVETEDGLFVKSKRLVNEANLVFYVNQNEVDGAEPDRLYLYNMTRNTPLVDYTQDNANTSFPRFSRINHLGILQREGGTQDGEGITYKMRITEHINNLLLRDSTNVKLGLAVSANVNLESVIIPYDVLTEDDTDMSVPVSSLVYPRGTVLYGNNTTNEEKKLYLEIFFTEPN